ncbi:hypothetical protein DY000_02037008 [Brassica cretica]|uniref:Uncharacterized protein n=1 Tax=Brassica cretica TaxID=69181 RepID=A0ABQ7BRF6_BRACR|nr:hypothetical protein DY000_02037008 [Brassica cretica]
MRRFVIGQAKNLIDQTRRRQPHHKSLRLLSLLAASDSAPVLSSPRLFSSSSDMSGSGSDSSPSSLPVTLDSLNPKVEFLFLFFNQIAVVAFCL